MGGLTPDSINFKIIKQMSFYFDKTPVLGAGLAWCVMNLLLVQIKSRRGLTTFIEHRGVNGRWLKPGTPFNIRITKFIRILEIKAIYQTDDEFLDDWTALGAYFLKHVRAHQNLVKDL